MEYEIYIDVAAVTGFAMDLLALFLTDVCRGRRTRPVRLMAASLSGTAVGILLFLLLPDYHLYTVCIHLLVNPCMVYLAFREKDIYSFGKDFGITYLAVFFAGGIMQWLYQTVFGGRYRMAAMLLTVLTGLFGAVLLRHFRRMERCRVQAVLVYEDRSVPLSAYYDTGNLLTDPYTKLPVSIVSIQIADRLFQEEKPAVRLIPYQSVGEENGLLEAYTIDKMLIYKGKRKQIVQPAVVGLAKERLFAGGEYQIILNGQL